MPVLHRELWLYGPRVVQFHQAQTSQTPVSGTVRLLFDGAAAPQNKKEIISTNKTRWVCVRIHFLILFGSNISRFQALSQEVMLMYYSRVSCAFRVHSAVQQFSISFKEKAGDLLEELHRPITGGDKVLGLCSPPLPHAPHWERLSSGWVYLCLSYSEGKVRS